MIPKLKSFGGAAHFFGNLVEIHFSDPRRRRRVNVLAG